MHARRNEEGSTGKRRRDGGEGGTKGRAEVHGSAWRRWIAAAAATECWAAVGEDRSNRTGKRRTGAQRHGARAQRESGRVHTAPAGDRNGLCVGRVAAAAAGSKQPAKATSKCQQRRNGGHKFSDGRKKRRNWKAKQVKWKEESTTGARQRRPPFIVLVAGLLQCPLH
jgi:hypothetical protein